MAAFKDLTGNKFGRWTVLYRTQTKYAEHFWFCRCDCGVEKEVVGSSLKMGRSKSCGCLAFEQSTKHGREGTATYNTWAGMIQRCTNSKYKWFHRYGGRGIKVSEAWKEDFRNFYADMGEKPEGMTLDRIDNDGNYCKENCRWATVKQQIRNRGTTVFLTFKGENRPMSEWAEIFGIKRKVLENRMKKGWTVEKALTTPKSGRWGVIKC